MPPFSGCIQRVVQIIKAENVLVSSEQKERLSNLIKGCYPDLREIVNSVEQYTIDGQLKIPEVRSETYFAKKIYQMVVNNHSANDIRKTIIENEVEFNSDYLIFLKGLFEHIFQEDIEEELKRNAMLIIGRYMESHQLVMDFEINTFCAMIDLLKVFNA